jgi:succinate dehydrogenase / fumarate reductase membrane anchor subunit
MKDDGPTMRTAQARVRYLGSARRGTEHFWRQRVTSVAGIPLTVAFVVIALSLLGRNHAAVVQILASPIVALLVALFIITATYHMWLGMQVIIEDYVHDEILKFASLMANTFLCFAVGLVAIYAMLKLSFGV